VNPNSLAWLLLPGAVCPVSDAPASITATHVTYAPSRLPAETPDQLPIHPPEGEGSGHLQIFSGISASGAMSNAANSAMTVSSWEPLSLIRFERDQFFGTSRPHIKLKVTSATPRRPLLPRTRRSC